MPFTSMRYIEPVVVRAAPKKLTFMPAKVAGDVRDVEFGIGGKAGREIRRGAEKISLKKTGAMHLTNKWNAESANFTDERRFRRFNLR